MSHTIQGKSPAIAPLFITQQRKLRDFLEDQDRIATIKGDWLYQMGSTTVRAKLVRQYGFTPVMKTPTGELTIAA